jgi:hypothetical protein
MHKCLAQIVRHAINIILHALELEKTTGGGGEE